MSKWYDGIETRAVEAYKAKGLKARTVLFYGDDCACALGAIARDELAKRRGEDQIKVIREFFQNEPVESEIWEFIEGFDSPESTSVTPATQAGIRTHNAVKEAGLFK